MHCGARYSLLPREVGVDLDVAVDFGFGFTSSASHCASTLPDIKYDMVWYGLVWYGMAWYGMVWHGTAWHGMVWYGEACKKLPGTRPLNEQGVHSHLLPKAKHILKEILSNPTDGGT